MNHFDIWPVLALIILGYSVLLAVRVKMQKMAITMEQEAANITAKEGQGKEAHLEGQNAVPKEILKKV